MLTKKKIVIVGANGQLGKELKKTLEQNYSKLGELPKIFENCEVFSFNSQQLNIANYECVFEKINYIKPYAVINCAAYTNVDGCEDEKEKAFSVNSLGPRNLAIACEAIGAKFIHISTDYVFDGEDKNKKIEWDVTYPINIYGKSKLFGEQYVRDFCSRYYILRTSWLYGKHGKNFVKTIIDLSKKNKSIRVVDDQLGTPTNVLDLCYAICLILKTEQYGIYHCSGKGEATWFDFACEIVRLYGLNVEVFSCKTSEFKTKAKRPKFSVLDNFMLRVTARDCFRDWQEALEDFCRNSFKLS